MASEFTCAPSHHVYTSRGCQNHETLVRSHNLRHRQWLAAATLATRVRRAHRKAHATRWQETQTQAQSRAALQATQKANVPGTGKQSLDIAWGDRDCYNSDLELQLNASPRGEWASKLYSIGHHSCGHTGRNEQQFYKSIRIPDQKSRDTAHREASVKRHHRRYSGSGTPVLLSHRHRARGRKTSPALPAAPQPLIAPRHHRPEARRRPACLSSALRGWRQSCVLRSALAGCGGRQTLGRSHATMSSITTSFSGSIRRSCSSPS
jgi:hypothetical protein